MEFGTTIEQGLNSLYSEQLKKGFRRLRFIDILEPEFRSYYMEQNAGEVTTGCGVFIIGNCIGCRCCQYDRLRSDVYDGVYSSVRDGTCAFVYPDSPLTAINVIFIILCLWSVR